MRNSEPTASQLAKRPRGWSGRVVVCAMFLFGAVVVSGFWTYWYFANRPFRALQLAILNSYPDTFPQVAGGRVESRGSVGPSTLRVVVRTFDFDPRQDQDRADRMADAITALAADHVSLQDYRRLEIVLFHKYREKRSTYWQRDMELTDGRAEAESMRSPIANDFK